MYKVKPASAARSDSRLSDQMVSFFTILGRFFGFQTSDPNNSFFFFFNYLLPTAVEHNCVGTIS